MPNVGLLVRQDSGDTLSKSTIIVIAVVSGSVVILLLALFWRLLARSCRRSTKTPLPPVQELAHQRQVKEQQIAAAHRRTWIEPDLQPHHFLSASGSTNGSSASLIRDAISHGPTRESSWALEDTTSTESSPYPAPLSMEDLMPPNPSFLPSGMSPHISVASVANSSSDGNSDANVPIPATPSEQTHSVESTASLIHTQGSPVRPRPPRGSRSRSRRFSFDSSAGTTPSLRSSQSRNTLLGPPHSIHSSVQIVLPRPLAPQLYPRADSAGDRVDSFYVAPAGDRKSVADQWMNVNSRPVSMTRERDASTSKGSSRPSSVAPRSRPRSHLSKFASTSSLSDGDSTRASSKGARSESQPPIPHVPSVRVEHAGPPRARSRPPSPGHGHSSSRHITAAPQAVPPPPMPNLAGYAHARGLVVGDNNDFYPPQPERGRARVARVPVPLHESWPDQPPMRVPIPPSSSHSGVREQRGKLRKNASSIS